MPISRATGLVLWRWLPLRRRWGIIQLIAVLSLLGIGIGTATLLSVQSIFKGFHHTVQELLLRYEPHLQLLPAQGHTLEMDSTTIARYAELFRARQVLPVISRRVLVRRGGRLPAGNRDCAEHSPWLLELPHPGASGSPCGR